MKASMRTIDDHGVKYEALMFVCPGCATPYPLPDGRLHHPSGIHMLPVNSTTKTPSWGWDGNLDRPTLSPSILSRGLFVCHSFLRDGVFEYLTDSTHPLAGQSVELPDLPEWAE